jgi:hypothetical protein
MVLGVKKWKYDCMEEPPLKQSLSSKSKPFHHQNHPKRSPTWAVHSIALRGPSLHPQHQKNKKKGKRKKKILKMQYQSLKFSYFSFRSL